jgi:hypothetical protein
VGPYTLRVGKLNQGIMDLPEPVGLDKDQDYSAFQKCNTVDLLNRSAVYKGQHVVWTVAAISMLYAAVLLVVAITIRP